MIHRVFITVAIVAAIAVGCTSTAPPPSINDLYEGLNEDLPRLDPALLEGRRIVIDPGHGGMYTGTQGQEGLKEKSVNLGVSLYLWGLLNEAGAEVFLTRSAERDFIETDTLLAADLRVRVEVVDSLQPDIFISVHHNAQPQRDPSMNAVETYYKFGDPASRDLGFAIHRHLMRNLGIDDGEVRPGNYYILRNLDIPSIIGESAYLTNPDAEDKLKLSDTQRLEAEAYFLGILEYFSRGTPRIERTSPLDSILTEVAPLTFALDDVGGLGIDPGAVYLAINGEATTAALDDLGRSASYQLPWDAPNGGYDVSLSVRNVLGNTSRVERFRFELNYPAIDAHFDVSPRTLPPGRGSVRVRARLVDARGLAIADGSRVAVEVEGGSAAAAAVVERGVVELPVRANDGGGKLTVRITAGEQTFEKEIARADDAEAPYQQMAFAGLAGAGIFNATLSVGDSILSTGSNSGIYFVPLDLGAETVVRIQAPGYRPLETSVAALDTAAADTTAMSPWYEGALVGKRFVLDPEGGFGPLPGIGELGLSGAYANLQVSRFLAEYLRAAGASVLLTRETEETLSSRDVVSVTNAFGADRYLEIRHRANPVDSGLVAGASFFPGSSNGQRMATSVQRRFAQALGLPVLPPYDEVTFPLQQTACPAIVVEAPSIADVEEELRLGEPWYQRLQAYGIFTGILDHYGYADTTTATVALDGDSLVGNWLVTVEHTWSKLTSPAGEASFVGLGPGTYAVIARRGDEAIALPPLQIPANPPANTILRFDLGAPR